jgi:hypothetical protein
MMLDNTSDTFWGYTNPVTVHDPVIAQVVDAMQRAQSLPEASPVRHALLYIIPMIAGIEQDPAEQVRVMKLLRHDLLQFVSFLP